MKFRIKELKNGAFIPQVKIYLFADWQNIDEQNMLWVTYPSYVHFEKFEDAKKVIENFKLHHEQIKTKKNYKIN